MSSLPLITGSSSFPSRRDKGPIQSLDSLTRGELETEKAGLPTAGDGGFVEKFQNIAPVVHPEPGNQPWLSVVYKTIAWPIVRRFERQAVVWAARRALLRTGRRIEIRRAIIAITMRSSTRVYPSRGKRFVRME